MAQGQDQTLDVTCAQPRPSSFISIFFRFRSLILEWLTCIGKQYPNLISSSQKFLNRWEVYSCLLDIWYVGCVWFWLMLMCWREDNWFDLITNTFNNDTWDFYTETVEYFKSRNVDNQPHQDDQTSKHKRNAWWWLQWQWWWCSGRKEG